VTNLSVNVNKVATLRNTRNVGVPSVVHCAKLCIDAGAHGITVHPRPDERHIRAQDVIDLAELLRAHPSVELNIEGNPFHGLLEHVQRVRPTQCTLVPDESNQSTSDHGWDLGKDGVRLEPILARLHAFGCRTSLFVDADPEAVARAHALGADRVELYTEAYAASFARDDHVAILARFVSAAERARTLGIGVNAGHDLNLDNLGRFLEHVPAVLEVSIGHALVADALEFGLRATVEKYLAITRHKSV
jgi:pyridoxine 5-phosphate synthase